MGCILDICKKYPECVWGGVMASRSRCQAACRQHTRWEKWASWGDPVTGILRWDVAISVTPHTSTRHQVTVHGCLSHETLPCVHNNGWSERSVTLRWQLGDMSMSWQLITPSRPHVITPHLSLIMGPLGVIDLSLMDAWYNPFHSCPGCHPRCQLSNSFFWLWLEFRRGVTRGLGVVLRCPAKSGEHKGLSGTGAN